MIAGTTNERPREVRATLAEEMAGASTINAPAPEEGEIVVPVPPDATPLSVKVGGRDPDEVLWFLNESGERLFAECRWNLGNGGKEVRPPAIPVNGGSPLRFPRRAPSTTSTSSPLRQTVLCGCSRGRARQTDAGACFPSAVTTANAGGANAIKHTDLSPLRGRDLILWRDSDIAGAKWLEQIIVALRTAGVASIRALNIAILPAEMIERIPEAKRGKFDVVDLIEVGTEPEAIRAAAEAACEPVAMSVAETARTRVSRILTDAEIDAEIECLSKLPLLAYERRRSATASRLEMRATTLDKLVNSKRQPEAANGQGQPLDLPTPELWPDRVDGAALLSEMTAAIRKYVVMEAGCPEAVALWTLHAHALDAFQISPRLAVTSPEKRCGKTTALDVVYSLAPRPLSTSNTSAAAIFRTIEAAQPTLLIDEADTFLTSSEEIRGVLNSGHRRSAAYVLRLVGDNHEPRQFSTWAAVAIALIGKLPETLQDRSILIRMRRRLPSRVYCSIQGGPDRRSQSPRQKGRAVGQRQSRNASRGAGADAGH